MRTLPLYRETPQLGVDGEGLPEREANCIRCALSSGVRTVCMAAEAGGADTGPMVLVVGESPGEHDDRQGRPFVGMAGQLMRDALKKHWTGQFALDYALRCAPGARKILASQIAACRPFVTGARQQLKPDRIVVLGSDAMASVIGRSFVPFSTRRGYAYTADGVPVFMVLNPVHALRNRFVRSWFDADVQWALTAPPPPKPPHDGIVLVVDTVEDSVKACADLALEDWVTLDTETFGRFHAPDFMILTLCLAGRRSDVAYVWDEATLQRPDVMAPVKRLLQNPKVRKVGQNIKYDEQAVRHGLGVWVRGTYGDVRLWRKLLQADALASLDVMQPLVGMGGGKDEAGAYVTEAVKELRKLSALRSKGKPLESPLAGQLDSTTLHYILDQLDVGEGPKAYAYAFIPPDVRVAYCARDVVSTDRLGDVFEAELQAKPELWTHWKDVVLGVHHAVTRMEFNGIGVSRPAIQQLQAAMAGREAELTIKLRAQGIENPNSRTELIELFYNKLKLPITKTTGKGQPSLDAETLDDLDHPIATLVKEWRQVTRFKTQYADGMEGHIRSDGRIHPSILLDGTLTGRPSCTDPNLMNIPRAGTEAGKMCRDVFAAPPGHVLIEADYSQIEIRVAAMLSQDPAMIGILKTGSNFHLATAKMIAPMFKIDPDVVTKSHELYDRAKTTNFAVLYGKGAGGIAMEFGITKAKGQALIDAIFGKFQRLKLWIDEQLAFARRTGYCRTWWNGKPARHRPLWGVADPNSDDRETAERSSWNTPIQGTATDFTNASLGETQRWLDSEGIPARLVLTVYDSIIAECREQDAIEVGWNLRRIMTSWNSDGVPIEAELKAGPAWGSMKALELPA